MAPRSIVVDAPERTMSQHLTLLREYAKRIYLPEESLKPWEEIEKSQRTHEFVKMAKSLRLTERDIVMMLLCP